MTVFDWVFWGVIVGLGFTLFLALQLRYFAGLALRMAANEQLKDATRAELRDIVVASVGGPKAPRLDEAGHRKEAERLAATYPAAIRQIRWGRRLSLTLPFAIAMLLVARRFLVGGA